MARFDGEWAANSRGCMRLAAWASGIVVLWTTAASAGSSGHGIDDLATSPGLRGVLSATEPRQPAQPHPASLPPSSEELPPSRPRVTGDAALGATYAYDVVGNRISASYANGLVTRYDYDRLDRLVYVETRRGPQVLQWHRYTLEPSGLRVHVDSSDADGVRRQTAYAYDGVARLVDETQSVDGRVVHQARYEYDLVGNRVSAVVDGVTVRYRYDHNDRLVEEVADGGASRGTTRYRYDANGNRIERSGPDGTMRYTYDDANRMVAVDDDRGTRATYRYDSDGRLTDRTATVAGITTSRRFLWDHAGAVPQVIEESTVDTAGTMTTDVVYTIGDGIVAQTRGGSTHYFVLDGPGSTRALADAGGAITDTFRYDGFGNLLGRTGTTAIDRLYRAEQRDAPTGLYNLRARWLDPMIGQFTQLDSFAGIPGDPPSLHKYRYANGDPVNRVDPRGTNSLADSGVALGIAATLTTAALAAYTIARPRAETPGITLPSVWDIVAIVLMKGAPVATATDVRPVVVAREDPDHKHHTIPIYLCGAEQQEPSSLPRSQHVQVHAGLAALAVFKGFVEEQATQIVFGRHRHGEIVGDLALTQAGRGAIADAIGVYYDLSGFGERGMPRIADVFGREKPRYVSGVATSLPGCVRRNR